MDKYTMGAVVEGRKPNIWVGAVVDEDENNNSVYIRFELEEVEEDYFVYRYILCDADCMCTAIRLVLIRYVEVNFTNDCDIDFYEVDELPEFGL